MKKQLQNHQILMLPLSKVQAIEQFLDFLTSAEVNAGKKAESHWVLNTTAGLSPNGTQEVEYFNAFMHQCRARSYSSVMIVK